MLLKNSINVGYLWLNPFSVSVNEEAGLKFPKEDYLVSLKNDRTLNLKFKEMTLNKFLMYVGAEFLEIQK